MFSQMPLNRPADAISQFTKDGHEGLAAAIVMTAVVDWRWPTKLAANYVRVLGWPSLRQELLVFWASPRGRYLRSSFGLEDLDITSLPSGLAIELKP